MSEWWTYRLGDLLMFSPRTYYRLIELYNRDVWPLHVVTLLAGGAILFLLIRRKHPRAIAALLAVLWLWIAYAFHWQRYSTILPYAKWFAALFVVQAVLLAISRPALRRSAFAWGLFIFALLIQPFVTGRPWQVFGIAPDPTAVATLAVLIAFDRRVALMIIPLLWVIISGATLWTMHG